MSEKSKILAVDDTTANLEVIIETLASAGYKTATATSGKRALKLLETYHPDLILLDIQMPEMNGFEVCQQLKARPKIMDIPIIFLTALSDIDSITKGFSLGAVDYITKPFREVELLARVDTHLQLRQVNQDLEKRVQERTHELEVLLEKLEASQLQLIQQEKMSALGNLVAGIAHEINNPLVFVGGNITVLNNYFNVLTSYLSLYEKTFPNPGLDIQEQRQKLEIDYVIQDLDKLLSSMETGCDRIQKISKSLRTFSRKDTNSKLKWDIHEGLESSLNILKYRLKANDIRPAIEIRKEYSELPNISCFPGQITQVFMNILANAIDMFDEIAEEKNDQIFEEDNPQIIAIRTQVVQDNLAQDQGYNLAKISITDNGAGMSEDFCHQVFDRSFTTKAVGKGTGLGLAISHQIIVDTHGGHLNVQSKVGQGTEFCIHLPFH